MTHSSNIYDIGIMEAQSRFTDFNRAAEELFLSWQTPAQLRKFILDIPNNEELFSYSAHYAGVDKLVLWNSNDKKMQVRLHVYSSCSHNNANNQIDIAKAHNHRWNFSTRILSGGYFHTIYRMEQLASGKYCLDPVMIRHENIGSSYSLHHSQYHSIIEEPNTVSLIVRGPVEKECFQVVTDEGGEIQLQDAPTLQKPEEKKQKTMTLVEYKNVLNQLLSLKII